MTARSLALIFFIVCLDCLVCAAAPPAPTPAPAKGDSILPKFSTIHLEAHPGGQSKPRWADQLKINWPAIVRKTNGQWLQIFDDGGYTLRGANYASGWVRKDEVMLMGSALANYTSEIIEAETDLAAAPAAAKIQKTWVLARLYWLRGVYWENGDPRSIEKQPKLALADYRKATCLDASFADAWMRTGRMVAEVDPIGSQAEWVSDFKTAYDKFINQPGTLASCNCNRYTAANSKAGRSTDRWSESKVAKEKNAPPTAPKCPPPQLYLDAGLANEKVLAEFHGTYPHLAPSEDQSATMEVANNASWDFDTAAKLNPNWYRPPSAQGDLLRTQVAATLEFWPDGTPKNEVSADELFHAVERYDQSIRQNDTFDESLRGRAEALRLLAVADLQCPTKMPHDAQYRGLLSHDPNARRSVIDAAYESAKGASFVRQDRNPMNLQTLAYIEALRSYLIGANITIEYLAQATETFKEAMVYSKSTVERRAINNLIVEERRISSWIFAGLAAEADVKFAKVLADAKTVKEGVKTLLKELPTADPVKQQAEYDLAKTLVKSQRAIDEIETISKIGKKKKSPADGNGIQADPSSTATASTEEKKAADAAAANAQPVAPVKTEDNKQAGKSSGGAKSKPAYTDPWPYEFPTSGELVSRIAQIEAWDLVLNGPKGLKKSVCRGATDTAIPCLLRDKLKEVSDGWGACPEKPKSE